MSRSLRADQVAATRSALVASGRRLFGAQGFAGTSVDEIAGAAGLTIGALYHHFPTKAAVFEAVFEQVHVDVMERCARAAAAGRNDPERMALGADAFLDAVLEADVQRIVIIDAPAVLGLARFTELDERYALAAMVALLEGTGVADAEILARLIMGALTRGAMLIANSPSPRRTRDAVSRGVRELLAGLSG